MCSVDGRLCEDAAVWSCQGSLASGRLRVCNYRSLKKTFFFVCCFIDLSS